MAKALKSKWESLPLWLKLLVIFAIGGLLTAILPPFVPPVEPPTPPIAAIGTTYLWVDAFNDADRPYDTYWDLYGSSPYLDAVDYGTGFSNGYKYRKNVTISGSTGAGTNYQVLLKIGESSGSSDYDFHLKGNCEDFPNDINFTDDDGTTPLNYYIERTTGVAPNRTAYFWVKVKDDLGTNVVICVYYGKVGATTSSSGSATFLFFDDLETWSGWVDYGTGNVTQDNTRAYEGTYSAHKTTSNDPNGAYKDIGQTLGRDIALEFRVNRNSGYSGGAADRIGLIDNSGNGYGWYFTHSSDYVRTERRDAYAGAAIASSGVVTDEMDAWSKGIYILLSDGTTRAIRYLSDGTLAGNISGSDSTYSSFTRVYIFGGYDYWVDQIFIRKYVSPEPSYSSATSEVISGNYVYTTGGGAEELGNFTFTDLPSNASAINQAKLQVYVRGQYWFCKIQFVIWNGSYWKYYSMSSDMPTTWTWVEWNVTTYLDNVTKINGVQLYLVTDGFNGYWRECDAVRLWVEYQTQPPEPQASNISVNNTIITRPTKFSVKWTDDLGLSGYIFSWNYSGSWVNETWTAWTGAPTVAWSNVTKTIEKVGTYGWRVYANDTDGNWGDTDVQVVTITTIDYGQPLTFTVDGHEFASGNDNYWEQVLAMEDCTGSGWVTKNFASKTALWVYLEFDVSTVAYMRAYEIQFYDGSAWISPNTHTNSSGWINTANSYDGNTSTYAEDNDFDRHYVTYKFSVYKTISSFRVYVADSRSNWTNLDLWIGREDSWVTYGSSPYINGTMADSSYIWIDESGKISGNYTLESPFSNYTSLLDAEIVIRYKTSGGNITVMFYFPDYWVDWRNITLTSTGGNWQTVNLTEWIYMSWIGEGAEKPIWFNPARKNEWKIRFKSIGSGDFYVEFVYVSCKGWTTSKTIMWLFDTMMLRRVNSSSYLIRKYNEEDEDMYYYNTSELDLSPILLYKLTGNATYLDWAKNTANWLETQPICRYFQEYDWVNNVWLDKAYTQGFGKLLPLAILAAEDASYKNLLMKAAENACDIWIKKPYYRITKSYINGTKADNITSAHGTSYGIAGLTYAAAVLNNQTLFDIAYRLIMNYTLGNVDLPYHQIYYDTGEVYGSYGLECKEDETYGYWMLALSFYYYHTNNETVKNVMYRCANASQYFWREVTGGGYFVYKVNADTGEQVATQAVHGFGLIDEALIHSYLLFGNSTWVYWVIQDFERNGMGIGDIIKDDVISHSSGQSYVDVNDAWNAPAKRVALILYNLNYSDTYKNSSFLLTYNKLYAGTATLHHQDIGWAGVISVKTWDAFENSFDIKFTTIFRNFHNVTTATINTFTELYAAFGNPFTGEVISDPLPTSIGTNTTVGGEACKFQTLWSDIDGLSHAQFYWNITGIMQLNGTLSFTGNPTEDWSNFTRELPFQEITIAWYIEANDTLDNWGNTSLQYLDITLYTSLAVGWNNFTAWNVDVGHTLMDVNASLHLDNINFTVITFEYTNGTQISLVWVQSTNEYFVENDTMTVTSTVTIWIYCKEAGEWFHNYP